MKYSEGLLVVKTSLAGAPGSSRSSGESADGSLADTSAYCRLVQIGRKDWFVHTDDPRPQADHDSFDTFEKTKASIAKTWSISLSDNDILVDAVVHAAHSTSTIRISSQTEWELFWKCWPAKRLPQAPSVGGLHDRAFILTVKAKEAGSCSTLSSDSPVPASAIDRSLGQSNRETPAPGAAQSAGQGTSARTQTPGRATSEGRPQAVTPPPSAAPTLNPVADAAPGGDTTQVAPTTPVRTANAASLTAPLNIEFLGPAVRAAGGSLVGSIRAQAASIYAEHAAASASTRSADPTPSSTLAAGPALGVNEPDATSVPSPLDLDTVQASLGVVQSIIARIGAGASEVLREPSSVERVAATTFQDVVRIAVPAAVGALGAINSAVAQVNQGGSTSTADLGASASPATARSRLSRNYRRQMAATSNASSSLLPTADDPARVHPTNSPGPSATDGSQANQGLEGAFEAMITRIRAAPPGATVNTGASVSDKTSAPTDSSRSHAHANTTSAAPSAAATPAADRSAEIASDEDDW